MHKIFYIAICATTLLSCRNSTAETSHKEISGEKLYNKYCVVCHGNDGTANIGGAKDLSKTTLSAEEMKDIIKNGSETRLMRAFKDDLNEEELNAIIGHLKTFKK